MRLRPEEKQVGIAQEIERFVMGKKVGNGGAEQDMWGSRRGLSHGALKRGFQDHLRYTQGRIPRIATLNDYYMALAYTVKDRLLHRWIRSGETYLKGDHSCGQLSFRRIPHGAAACEQFDQPGDL